jgi:hypothetical protein
MDQQFKQGYRMHCVLSNLNRLDVEQLNDTDQQRVETARGLLEEVSLLTRPDDRDVADVRADSWPTPPSRSQRGM